MILQPGRSTLVFLFLFGARRIDFSHAYRANPPSIEYALTELGCSLLEPVRALVKWTATHKNSPCQPLTPEQKQQNHALSKRRIVVEHAVRYLKRFRILSSTYTNIRKRFGLRLHLLAAIANLLR